jgi:hypothetical protein
MGDLSRVEGADKMKGCGPTTATPLSARLAKNTLSARKKARQGESPDYVYSIVFRWQCM